MSRHKEAYLMGYITTVNIDPKLYKRGKFPSSRIIQFLINRSI